jgi:hypothetical protein
MKIITAVCASLMGAAMLAGGPALADQRCPADSAAAGLCAPLHLVGDDFSRSELLRMRAYERGYRDALNRRGRHEEAPPPAIALDGKEGYSQSAQVHRQYLDRSGNFRRGDRRYDRRYDDRDDYYDRRGRRSEREEVIDFATDVLRGLSN